MKVIDQRWLVLLLVGCGGATAPGSLALSGAASFKGTTAECPETTTVRLSNAGAAPLTLSAVTKESGDAVRALPFLDEPAPVFTIEGLPASLAGGASVELTVRFTPNESKGDFAAMVALRAGGQSVTLSLGGQRMIADGPDLGPFDFGAVVPGATASIPFELSPSTTRLRYSNEVIEGPGFSRLGTALVFRPSMLGRFTGLVRLDARTAPECSPRAVTASLLGDAVSATLTTTPVVDFGFVPPGRTRWVDLKLENVAFTSAIASAFSATPSAYAVEAPDGGLLVPRANRDAMTKALIPGSALVRVGFSPTDAGVQSGTLVMATDVAAQPQVSVTLRGVGGGGVVAVTPKALDFGPLTMMSRQQVRVSNVGIRPSPPDPRGNLFLGIDGGMPYFELRHVSGATGTVSVTMTSRYDPGVGVASLSDVTVEVTALPGASANDLHLFSTDLDRPDVVVPIIVQ